MSNIIPFESGTLPSYLANINPADFNSDLTAHAGGGFPVISIKGKVFAIVRDGNRKVIPNPKDPDSPATAIDVVLLKANKGTSKVFYAKGYTEGAEGVKPDCFSNDGVRPDSSIESPPAKMCAVCPNNQWGSKIGDNGSKGKACQDSVRMAVATPNQVNEPYLLRVPPASIRSLGEYGQMLAKRGVAYNMVVTKVGFDLESPTPKLTFKPVGLIDEATFKKVTTTLAGDTVAQILGSAAVVAAVGEDPEVKEPEVSEPEVAKPAEPEKKRVTKKAEPKQEAVPEVEVEGFNLDDLNFDD
jgi:hypothetical protein